MTGGLLMGGWKVLVLCAAPFLLVLALVGLAVGLLQAATGVQDQASAQASRLAAAALTFLLAGPFVLRTLVGFTRGLWGDLTRYLQ